VYESGITKLSTVVGKEALTHKTRKFIEASTGEVYKINPELTNESGEIQPWTGIGKAKLEAEKALQKMKNLPLVIVRLPPVYGPGAFQGVITTSMCIFAVHNKTGQKVEFPSVSFYLSLSSRLTLI
jgi:nucleoside-diphosphate-sugar epimerase